MDAVDRLDRLRHEANHTRYRRGASAGHYESFFVRANHPSRPLGFWIRYTIFSPAGRPDQALGELWAIVFDGETGTHTAVKREVPLESCRFDPDGFNVEVDGARLGPGTLAGSAGSRGHAIAWDLAYAAETPALFLLPSRLYETAFPSAKGLVAAPLARFNGRVSVDDRALDVEEWIGSQNHNWGTRHTDHYAWGQVAGFDESPSSFLEVITARVPVVPLWSPFLTMLVVRHDGREIRLNRPLQGWRARGAFEYFRWTFTSEDAAVHVQGTITAPPDAFVALSYANPPGGTKTCLNTKIAACELRVRDKDTGRTDVLSSRHRAAFEILTDDDRHGLAIRV